MRRNSLALPVRVANGSSSEGSFCIPARSVASTLATDALPIALLVAIVIAGAIFRDVSLAQFFILSPTFYFGALVADVVTAAVLGAIAWSRSSARRSSFVLALIFAANAIFAALAILLLPIVPNDPPAIVVARGIGVLMYTVWHTSIALGAFVYAAVRTYDDRPITRRFRLIGGGSAVLVVVVAVTFAFVVGGGSSAGNRVPDRELDGLHASGLAWIFGPLLALAAIVVYCIGRRDIIDRAFALALLALALDALLVGIGHRFNASYYAGRLLLMLSSAFVLVAAVRALLTSELLLIAAEQRVRILERESTKRAQRIRALWKIASHVSADRNERARHILEIATASLRPDLQLLGCLSHLDGESVIIDATAWTIGGIAEQELIAKVYPGARFPFDRSILQMLDPFGSTGAWDDLGFLEGRGMLIETIGWRAFIGTRITVGRDTYFLSFTSPHTTIDEPFAEHDVAFVEVVASFLAGHVTQQAQYERIRFQIEHDALTGLENRVQFRRRIREEITARREFTIAFANLDHFRHLNEREGHQTADEVLVEVATCLQSLDEGNSIARTSGDEFGILIRGAGSIEAATAALERYAERFRRPFHTGDRAGTHMLMVGASIGGARFPADGSTAEELMLRSDAALGIAKGRGGATTLLFDENMAAIIEANQNRAAELGSAIADGQLALVYQPTFELASRRIAGAEALVRWDHPTRGRISPGEFISFAERNGLIDAISHWVLDRLVHDLEHTDPLPPGCRVYFNLAATMLESFPFIARLDEIVHRSPELVAHIGIEVTETAAMQNVERALSTIELFRSWGFSVAIDDFGTGYSSLSYLKLLNVDVIKIDQSFITGVAEDERDAELAEMLIRITNRFGFTTLAEGIETEAQAAWLLERGCRLGQGYLVGRPDSFAAFIARLREAHAAPLGITG